MKPLLVPALVAFAISMSTAAHGADSTKDIVLDRVLVPVGNVAPATGTRSDAMVVSVLLESPDGSLTPKSADTLFRTGDRFRIKMLASRTARISIFNTTPSGETKSAPIWQGEVVPGQETITPRLALVGQSGVDLLHVVMEPAQQASILTWLSDWLRASKDTVGRKDVRVDVQNTASASYLLNAAGEGLVSTIQIAHVR